MPFLKELRFLLAFKHKAVGRDESHSSRDCKPWLVLKKQCTSRRSQGCRLKKWPENQHMQTEKWCLNNNPANYIIQTSALIQRYSSNQSQSFPTGLERTTVLLCVFCWMWPWTVLLSRRINKPSASRSCIMKYVAVRYVTPKQPSHCKQ